MHAYVQSFLAPHAYDAEIIYVQEIPMYASKWLGVFGETGRFERILM